MSASGPGGGTWSRIVVCLAVSLVMARLPIMRDNSDWPFLDMLVACVGLFASWLVARVYLENWLYWIVIDALTIFLFIKQDLEFTALLFVAYLVISCLGFRTWLKTYQRQHRQPESGLIPDEVLAAVPGCESGRPPLAVHALAGGGGHNDVRPGGNTGRQIRGPAPIAAPGARRLRCHAGTGVPATGCAQWAGTTGSLAAAGDASWMVMEFIAGNPWQEQDLVCAAGARRLGERLALVHAMPVAATMRPMDAAQSPAGNCMQSTRAVTRRTCSATRRPALHDAPASSRQSCRAATCRRASITVTCRPQT